MTRETDAAVSPLRAPPEPAHDRLAPRLNAALDRLEDLRADLQEGLDSGPPVPADGVFGRLEAKYSAAPDAPR